MKKYNVTVNGFAYEVEIDEVNNTRIGLEIGKQPLALQAKQSPVAMASREKSVPESVLSNTPDSAISAPMQGKILAIKAAVGENVVPGQVVAILEAMKMENEIIASEEGSVATVDVMPGQSVNAGDVLITLS